MPRRDVSSYILPDRNAGPTVVRVSHDYWGAGSRTEPIDPMYLWLTWPWVAAYVLSRLMGTAIGSE